ncbi:outer membrane beta-barrel protein [Alteromonas sp. C1M14]|uniref:outer membrane beta-barrel protein n=1 Tax=Alteromonas sp. C1M14 TaxID=2841567 RepID=UPI001C09847C|nr:outer membrane beta-barrel protein [Alteromonas sp. C1M14]MBU2979230.1 porin family protein [Alteromonas sp. C1M14]
MNKGILTAACFTLACFGAQGTERMYGVASLGYADVAFNQADNSKMSYGLALGHQFSDQWYVEGGYLNLIDADDGLDTIEAEGLYLALLGKAGGPVGELYYKLGIMDADVKGFQGDTEGSALCIVPDNSLQDYCAYDEGVVAGLVGLGFDYHIGINSMIRLEGLYIRGEDDFEASLISLGFRYNFN